MGYLLCDTLITLGNVREDLCCLHFDFCDRTLIRPAAIPTLVIYEDPVSNRSQQKRYERGDREFAAQRTTT